LSLSDRVENLGAEVDALRSIQQNTASSSLKGNGQEVGICFARAHIFTCLFLERTRCHTAVGTEGESGCTTPGGSRSAKERQCETGRSLCEILQESMCLLIDSFDLGGARTHQA
jgi:hypothetical protein